MVNIILTITGIIIMTIGFSLIGWYYAVPEIMKQVVILVLGIIFFIIGMIMFIASFWLDVENK